MGAEISSLIIQPLILGIAVALLIIAELKYSEEKTNKALVGVGIALVLVSIILGFIMSLMI